MPAMTERWDQQMDRKLAPAKAFIKIIPLWFRIIVIAATLGATLYLGVTDRQPYHAIARAFGSIQLGALVTWLLFLLPCVVVLYGAAALLHRRRKKQDFPRAIVRR
jgi:amino acid transporter